MTEQIAPEWGAARTGPLTGVRVLDLSQQLPGPYGTALLASLGASVIKVEPPAGDPARQIDPPMFDRLNRDKSIVTIDLKSDTGRYQLAALLVDAKVFIEGFRPGVAARLGVDPDRLLARHESLLYCSLSGFGQTGPLAQQPAHDINVQAAAGALAPDERHDRIGVAWVDLSAGMTAALSIVAAIHGGRTGYLELSLFDTALSWAELKPNAAAAREPVYGTVRASDGSSFAISLLEDAGWPRLCAALGWTDWQTDARYVDYQSRLGGAVEIRARLDETFARLDSAAVMGLSERFDVAIVPLDPRHPIVLAQREARRLVHDFSAPTVPLPVPRPSARASNDETN